MDEPLSNLDAKLRVSMRSEIIKLHQRLKTTFIYVTHDQTEAMTMGSKIVVMNKGEIQQVADPVTIYEIPSNKFVASFIGSPQMNFLNAMVDRVEDNLFIENSYIKYDIKNNELRNILEEKYCRSEITIGIRPEDIEVVKDEMREFNESFNIEEKENNYRKENNHEIYNLADNEASSKLGKTDAVVAEIDFVEILGSETYIHFKINDANMICKVNGVFRGKEGQAIKVRFNFIKSHFFDKDSEKRIGILKKIN